MKTNRIIRFSFAFILAMAAVCSCIDPNVEENISFVDNSEFLKRCTPVYKGSSYVFGEKTAELTLYSTETKDEYYIPLFFLGDGEMFFTWDKENNTLSVEESYTGMSNGAYPVYIMSQKKYDEFKGDEAQRSFYDIATKSFNFNVLMQTADDDGIVYVETNLVFAIESTL
jgi:hypothetical protein